MLDNVKKRKIEYRKSVPIGQDKDENRENIILGKRRGHGQYKDDERREMGINEDLELISIEVRAR